MAKRAIVLVTPQRVLDVLKGRGSRVIELGGHELPEDVRVVEIAYIRSGDVIAMEVESDAFGDVPGPRYPVIPTPELLAVELPVVEPPSVDEDMDADV